MKSYNQAKKILSNAKLKIKDEIVDIKYALNRIISENILSKVNYPAGDNAAFDGFVVENICVDGGLMAFGTWGLSAQYKDEGIQ